VEDKFAIKIPATDWQEINTVEELFNCVVAHVPRDPSASLAENADFEIDIWERLKALLSALLKLKPEKISQSTWLY
jgi:hypothetical protein